MPELDGLEAMHRIRRLPGHEALPIIALSAHALEEERFLAAGMSVFLAKPFKADDLFAVVEGGDRSSMDIQEIADSRL